MYIVVDGHFIEAHGLALLPVQTREGALAILFGTLCELFACLERTNTELVMKRYDDLTATADNDNLVACIDMDEDGDEVDWVPSREVPHVSVLVSSFSRLTDNVN